MVLLGQYKCFLTVMGVLYIYSGGQGIVLFEGRGFLQIFVGFYCDMVRKVVPIVLSEVYLFDYESALMC